MKYCISNLHKCLSASNYNRIRSPISRLVKTHTIGKIVSYYSKGPDTTTKFEAYLNAAFLIAAIFLRTLYHQSYMLYVEHLSLRIRISICSVLYRKALKLNNITMGQISIGKIVTLMSKDIVVFDRLLDYGNEVWTGVFTITVMLVIMYRQIGVCSFIGMGFLLLTSPLQSKL